MLNTDSIRILHVNLTSGETRVEERAGLFRDYLGGTGVAVKLLDELVHDDRDALDPEQPIIFAIGPLTTIFPVVTKGRISMVITDTVTRTRPSHTNCKLSSMR